MSSASDQEEDPALNFLSTSFDPVKALKCSPSKVCLPHPTVQPLDNLHLYASVVEGTRQTPRQRTPNQSAEPAKEKKAIVKKKGVKTVLDFMQKHDAGPFSMLQRCHSKGQQVRVTMRHCAGVRGLCEGLIIVYDKHLNMVLGQVTEWCTPFRTVANGGITLTKKQRRKKKKAAAKHNTHTEEEEDEEERHAQDASGKDVAVRGSLREEWEVCRTIKQLFIRGENIIHVSCDTPK